MTQLVQVRLPGQMMAVEKLAREIWIEHYVPIVGREQIEYMLARFQSEAAIRAQISDGVDYSLLSCDDVNVGYMAVAPEPEQDALMISKLYVLARMRGKGFGRRLLNEAHRISRSLSRDRMWLTVNKHNARSIEWYRHMGFRNVKSVVQDIGGGFVMDDYKMEMGVNSI